MLVFSSSYVALSNCSGQLSIVKIIFCCFHELNEGADYGEIYSSHKEKLGRDQTLKKHFAPSVCISSNCKMYLSPIAKCICPNCKMYLSQLQKMYLIKVGERLNIEKTRLISCLLKIFGQNKFYNKDQVSEGTFVMGLVFWLISLVDLLKEYLFPYNPNPYPHSKYPYSYPSYILRP